MQTKKTVRNEEAREECRFFIVETHKHLTASAVLTARVQTSKLYTFQRSLQTIRNIRLC